jgi:hypothetical protein
MWIVLVCDLVNDGHEIVHGTFNSHREADEWAYGRFHNEPTVDYQVKKLYPKDA